MKIFILEDNDERIKFFKEKFLNHSLFIAKNVEEAIELYSKNKPFEMLFLDHDLDNRTYVHSDELNTGYQFVKFLVNNLEDNPYIVIHTMNEYGGANMKVLLEQHYDIDKIKRIYFHELQYIINLIGNQ